MPVGDPSRGSSTGGGSSPRFDAVGERYEQLTAESISFSGQTHDFFLEAKARALLDVARRRIGRLDSVRALDVGAGPGSLDAHLTAFGSLDGVDLSTAMVEAARRRNPRVRYHLGSGTDLPFEDDAFDVTFTSCVLHHVERQERRAFTAELRRVTRSRGLVCIFEHNPLNPLTRIAVSRCEFDDDAVLLGVREARSLVRSAGLKNTETRYILFLPIRGRLFGGIERALSHVPLGAQYYVAADA